MQENGGRQRINARPLRCSLVSLVPRTALENASFEPHPDEPEAPGIGDSVRQYSQRPPVVNRVDKLRISTLSTQFIRRLMIAACNDDLV